MDRNVNLLNYIKNDILRNSKANISDDTDLLATGILDSLGILQLVAYIDETFNIEVPDEDVVYENFYSINALTTFLKKLEK
jgi:acyl carrier protein